MGITLKILKLNSEIGSRVELSQKLGTQFFSGIQNCLFAYA
jgi:hypothetical protein